MATQDTPVAFVTGASRGIGRAAAIALAHAGFDVVITARTVQEGEGRAHGSSVAELDVSIPIPGSLESAARQVEQESGRHALPIRMDLLDVASVEGAVSEALETSKRIDVLVNNAAYEGIGLMDKILDLRLDDLETVLAGVRNQFRLVQCVLPQMLDRQNGCVITTGSVAATLDPPGPAGDGGWGIAHAISKAAVQRFTPSLHAEFRTRGIRSFTVDPGFVITEQMRATGVNKRFEEAGALTNPAEVPGTVIAWLAKSDEADSLSGQLVSSLEICNRYRLLPGWSAESATWPALQK